MQAALQLVAEKAKRPFGAIHQKGLRTHFSKLNGRDGQIRTADPSHPKRVLYQAEPRPDTTEPAQYEPACEVLISLHQQGRLRSRPGYLPDGKPDAARRKLAAGWPEWVVHSIASPSVSGRLGGP